jgi:predicted DNA-binding transcriptional regulator YafY
VLDQARWGDDAPPTPPHLEALQQAVVQGVQVRLGYRDRTRAPSERTVHPLGLVAKGNVWYLVAGTDAGMRTFRVWRVQSVELLTDPVVRPDGFDLATTWQEVVARMDEQRIANRVRARVDPVAVGWLRGQFGARLVVVDADAPAEADPDGWLTVEIGFGGAYSPSIDLAGYAAFLEVLDPPEVRDGLAELGARLVARYGPAA